MLTWRPRLRLDIRLRDFAYALLACVWARHPERLDARLEAAWSPARDALACRSVRSGFHLLLECLALPPGSGVVVPAGDAPGPGPALAGRRPTGRPGQLRGCRR